MRVGEAVRHKFKIEHLRGLIDKNSYSHLGPQLTDYEVATLESSPHSYTVCVKENVILCGGVVDLWSGRGMAWGTFSPDCKPYFFPAHAIAKRFLEECPHRRIEAFVEKSFIQGHRWVKLLGFKLEVELAEKFLPNGGDASLYSRVNHE